MSEETLRILPSPSNLIRESFLPPSDHPPQIRLTVRVLSPRTDPSDPSQKSHGLTTDSRQINHCSGTRDLQQDEVWEQHLSIRVWIKRLDNATNHHRHK